MVHTRTLSKTLHTQKGFTLVEVLLALAVLLAVVLPLWQWQERMAFARADDRYEYQALVLLQRLAEQTMAAYDAELLPALKEHGEVERDVDGFRCTWHSASVVDTFPGNSALLQLQLSIFWEDVHGAKRERSLWIMVEDTG